MNLRARLISKYTSIATHITSYVNNYWTRGKLQRNIDVAFIKIIKITFVIMQRAVLKSLDVPKWLKVENDTTTRVKVTRRIRNHSKSSCFRTRNRKQEGTNNECRLTQPMFPGNVCFLKINTNLFVQINFYFPRIIKLHVRRLDITLFFFLFSLALHIQINTTSATFDHYVVYELIFLMGNCICS